MKPYDIFGLFRTSSSQSGSLFGFAKTSTHVASKGRCLGPAIIYADERSREQCEWMRDVVGERRTYEITGARLDTQYPAPS